MDAERSIEVTIRYDDGAFRIITLEQAQELYDALGDIHGIDRHSTRLTTKFATSGDFAMGGDFGRLITGDIFGSGPGTPTPSGRPTKWIGTENT